MPSKRVSLKGKGADLFFGGDVPEAAPPEPPAAAEPPTEAAVPMKMPMARRATPVAPASGTNERTNKRSHERSNGRTVEHADERSFDSPSGVADEAAVHRTNDRTNERPTDRPDAQEEPRPDKADSDGERRRVRHSFDIFEDQLQALAEIQVRRFTATRRKPKLGELVQEALDRYIEASARANDRSDERTNGRKSGR